MNVRSPLQTRASQIASHLPNSQVRGPWKREHSVKYVGLKRTFSSMANPFYSSAGIAPIFKDLNRQAVKVSFPESSADNPGEQNAVTPTVSEDGSGGDDGVTVNCDSPPVAHGDLAASPSARKA